MESVDKLLNEIGLEEIPRLVIFNKADLVNPLWAKVIAARFKGVVCSALDAGTFADLLQEIEKRIWSEEDTGLRLKSAEG
jgi:GTP-binding protein HflX